MKSVYEYLKAGDEQLLKGVIFNLLKNEYNKRIKLAGHRGRFWDNALNWYDRNVEFSFESSNDKFTGWHLIMWNAEQKQIFIETGILQYKVKDYKHAINVIMKYMQLSKKVKNPITL